MRWPLMWKATHDVLIERRTMQLTMAATNFQAAVLERDYWKKKAEKLLDHALFKRGEITAPVFEDAPERKSVDPTARLFEALRVTEIETMKPAAPVTPMP